MISIQSLSDNLLPNVYIKSVTLDSTYSGTITNSKTDGYSDPENNKHTTKAIGDQSASKLMVSMKFAKSKNVQTSMMHLLGDELSEYIKIFVHQITNQTLYENILAALKFTQEGYDSANIRKSLTSLQQPYDPITMSTQKIDFKSMTSSEGSKENGKINMPEQVLDDGTILYESLLNTSFSFDNDAEFLAYIIVPAIIHPDLEGSNIPIGKVSADIILLNGVFQNEGLVFTIATPPAGSNLAELAKFGKPGEIWAGSVHQHQGNFMAGQEHTPGVAHPVLDYQVVPVTKYVDNRIGEKIERKILNTTKAFEQMHSLTTRYKNSATNLLDYESYKKISFISDIYLSQDYDLNINGMVSIDKLNLIKKNCAFPYIFDNIKSQSILGNLLSQATRLKLDFYENDRRLLEDGQFSVEKGVVLKTAGDGDITVEHVFFKRKNDSISTYKYRVEVTYKDPTVEYVKSVLGKIPPAQESVDILLKKIQIRKSSAQGDNSAAGYNPITQRINKELIDELLEEAKQGAAGPGIVSGQGILKTVWSLFADGKAKAVFGQSDTDVDEWIEIRNYVVSLMKLETASIDSLLVLSSLLQNLRTQLENILASFGVKPLKDSSDNQYGNLKNQGDVNSAKSNRTIKASQSNEITVVDRGYSFISFMEPQQLSGAYTNLPKQSYKWGCRLLLKQLLAEVNSPVAANDSTAKDDTLAVDSALQQSIAPKGLNEENISNSAFTYLTIPPWGTKLKGCVLLPSTVIDVTNNKSNVDDIFYAILKYNYLLNESTSKTTGLNDRATARLDLDTVLRQKFGTFLPLVASGLEQSVVTDTGTVGSSQTVGEQAAGFSSQIDLPPGPPKITPVEIVYSEQKNKNFILNSLLSKLLISRKYSLVPPMSKPGFLPYSAPAGDNFFVALAKIGLELSSHHADKESSKGGTLMRFPLPVIALSPINSESNAPFKTNHFSLTLGASTQKYIEKNIINPEKLWYYWFIHQNIVRVEYFDGYEETTDTVFLKNKTDPYKTGASKQITRRNVKRPRWKLMNNNVLSNLATNQQLFCRVTRYEYPYYVDKDLVKALDLPLINNYFVMTSPKSQEQLAGDEIAG